MRGTGEKIYMQTDTINLTCTNNTDGFNCTTPSIFSGGDMFISLLLLIFLIISIIYLSLKAIFYVKVFKRYERYSNDIEGKEFLDL